MSGVSTPRPSFKTYIWFAAVAWIFVVAISAAQLLLTGSFDSGLAFRTALREWLPWVALAPLVAWLSVRFPFDRKEWPLSLVVHLTACAAVLGACTAVMRWTAPGPPPFRGRMSRLSDHRRGWFGPYSPGPPAALPWAWDFQRARGQIPIYWLIVAVVHALAHYRRSQDRERKAAELSASLAKARLQALHLQLQPHFLFNSLNAISVLVHRDPLAADEMIGNLSDLLRMSLDRSEQPETTLRREMELVACYLDIERARFGDRLQVGVNVDPETLEAWVPALLLQPLIENAVRHGLEAKSNLATVEICAVRRGERLEVAVTDRGPGLGAAGAQSISGGIGLSNTRARLRELYGDEASLRMANAAEGGCVVTVELPYATHPHVGASFLASE